MNPRTRLFLVAAVIGLPVLALGSILLTGANEATTHSPEQISTELQAPDDHSEGEGKEAHGEEEGEEAAETKPLTPQQMQEAGIVVEPVALRSLPKLFRAPGEVTLNDYTSSIVSPRIRGTVLQRHVTLGASVRKGEPLIRLFSVEMAEAQSAFILAAMEYERVQKIARDVISERRRQEAKVAYDEARTRLETYGLTPNQIDELARAGSGKGEFDLIAGQDGVVVSEDFRVGEVIEPGKMVMEISDGRSVWIEARVSGADAAQIESETAAIFIEGQEIAAKVVQIDPKLDEATRTIGVRLEASNEGGRLKPGTFVDVHLYGAPTPVLAVPTEAVLRTADGDWAVQVEQAPGLFRETEVEALYAVESMTAIAGIPEGTRIAVRGAFFVAAEAAKSGFDPHSH